MNIELRPDERIDDLQREGLRIIQGDRAFRFGMDSVLLADFAWIRPRDRVIDLGTGSGVLPLLLHARMPSATFDAVELNPDAADMARRTMRLNGLEAEIAVHAMDLRDAPAHLPRAGYALAVCNPPYDRHGMRSRDPGERLARFETGCTLHEILNTAGQLVRPGGRMALVHRAERLLDVMDGLRAAGMEPKRVRLVCPYADRPPNLALIEGVKQARPGLHWLPMLVVRDADGKESAEIDRIYHRGEGTGDGYGAR